MAIVLGSYLTLCTRTMQLSNRNVSGGHNLELAESGMEDALWSMNKGDWTGWTITGTTATKSTSSAFTYDNGVVGSIAATVTNYNVTGATRTVTVIGSTSTTVKLPDGTTSIVAGTTTTRTLSASSTPAGLFVNALDAVSGNVSFSSGGKVDSYDSSLGDYTAQTPTYSATVASELAGATSATVVMTNAQINGYVASLYSGGPSYSTSAKLWAPADANPGTVKIDTARISTNPYQPVFDIKVPTLPTSPTPPALSNPTTNSTVHIGTVGSTATTIYTCTGLDMTGTTTIVVDSPVQLVMSSGAAFYIGLHGGTPAIQVSSGASLEVFSSGDLAIYGYGIVNASKNPKNVAVYSSNTLTVPDMNLPTISPYYGVIYTPTGCFTVAANSIVYGAIVAKKISLTGTSPAIHYDLALRNEMFPGIDTPFAVANVSETTNP